MNVALNDYCPSCVSFSISFFAKEGANPEVLLVCSWGFFRVLCETSWTDLSWPALFGFHTNTFLLHALVSQGCMIMLSGSQSLVMFVRRAVVPHYVDVTHFLDLGTPNPKPQTDAQISSAAFGSHARLTRLSAAGTFQASLHPWPETPHPEDP